MAEKELVICDECGGLFFKGVPGWKHYAQNVRMYSMATPIVTTIFKMEGVCIATGTAQRANM